MVKKKELELSLRKAKRLNVLLKRYVIRGDKEIVRSCKICIGTVLQRGQEGILQEWFDEKGNTDLLEAIYDLLLIVLEAKESEKDL